MADIDLAVARELKQLERLGLLEPGEILSEVELAVLGAEPGALIVTDKRVLFVRTTLLRKRTRVVAVPLLEISGAEGDVGRWLGRELGVLRLAATSTCRAGTDFSFERIPGGQTRADELATTILRQRDLLRRA